MMKYFVVLSLFNLFSTWGQNFINGDLEALYANFDVVPSGWQMVPYTDPNCQATSYAQATPDIYSLTGVDIYAGANGLPYSGNTFVGGCHGKSHPQSSSNYLWQEGIMQTVSGFILDSIFTIRLYQSVINGEYAPDTSGSWMVILDNSILTITEPTKSTISMYDSNLEWELRTVVFKATDTVHAIKFLPQDDDTYLETDFDDPMSSLVMGIDSISIQSYSCIQQLDLGSDIHVCEGTPVVLDATMINASYLWSDGSTYRKLNVSESGDYSVQVTVHDCPVVDSITYFDTIHVEFIPYPLVEIEESIQMCENETILLDVYNEGATYVWQDSSIFSYFNVSDTGIYYVEADIEGCKSSDTTNVSIKYCYESPVLQLPNVFSPNGDGINDVFVPVQMANLSKMHLVVLNRWGNIVFESNSPNFGWNGNDINGKAVSDGVYFWTIEYADEMGNEYNDIGTLEVLR